MVSVPSDLSTPLQVASSSLTPNAQARKRLGEIADDREASGHLAVAPASSWAESMVAPLQPNGFFVAWSMPPLKRGLSLADTREALKAAGVDAATPTSDPKSPVVESPWAADASPSFIDAILAAP